MIQQHDSIEQLRTELQQQHHSILQQQCSSIEELKTEVVRLQHQLATTYHNTNVLQLQQQQLLEHMTTHFTSH